VFERVTVNTRDQYREISEIRLFGD
jgi:hypothetical protein